MSSALRELKLIELCAPSIDYDAQIKAASTAFDNQMYEIIDATGVVRFIPNIMGLTDSNLVDILAWQFHVDFYDPRKSLEFRKRLVQLSIQWHITKGTYQLVKDVLDTYWPGGASLLEWFEYYDPLPPGKPPDPPGPPPVPPESPIIVPPPPGGSWHDRYRFRIYIDETIIDPADEAAVLTLIEHYKPISRWCEGIFRATVADCFIGWTGGMLRFVIRESEAADIRPFTPDNYALLGPTDGAAAVASELFTVGVLPGGMFAVAVTVTPNDGGGGGTFEPSSVTLTTENPTGKFAYTPASGGSKTIATTNDGGLTDPAAIVYTVQEIPETIPGLLAWWKSTDVPAQADASPITVWPSRFGSRDATPSGLAAPLYYSNILRGVIETAPGIEPLPAEQKEAIEKAEARSGSHPSIWFPIGAGLRFTPPLDMTGGWTCVLLAYNANSDVKALSFSTAGAPAPEVIDNNGPYSYISDVGYRVSADMSAVAPVGRFALYLQTSPFGGPGSYQIWCDRTSFPPVGGGGWPYSGPLLDQIGVRGDGSGSQAHYVELLFYRGIMSPADITKLQDYFSNEYGVPQ